MINSRILAIYVLPPTTFEAVIETDTGLYEMAGWGYRKIDDPAFLKTYKKESYPDLEGQTIVSVKAEGEFSFARLSNGYYIIYHIDTPFLDIISRTDAEDDPEFLEWVEALEEYTG